MLKALELVGFKSFADRTQFDFPPGITAVVGPNGSGKSNVVDAIKWVLGEQSARSLRGKEMADVIFNGSGSRPPVNTAETTLTFDNSDRLLPIDTPEVHVTRRVYRSGEGEYLINRQPSRLRDIRDLFAGTGLGTEAYSVIEQGKVDVLLQSSPRDRRMIFEEAAGISRFKAKKIESLRRLERVDQNLLRLADIVDEVEHQLRNVRKQAAKARRYKDYADRLQELRTQVGLADWRHLGGQLHEIDVQRRALADATASAAAEAQRYESQILELEAGMEAAQVALGGCEARNAENRERIATAESTIAHERARARELEQEVARHRRHLASMSLRAGDVQQQVDATTAAVASAALDHERLADSAAEIEGTLAELRREQESLAASREQHRSGHLRLLRGVAALANEIGVLRTQLETVDATRARQVQQVEALSASRVRLESQQAEHEARQQSLIEAQATAAAQLADAQELLSLRRRQHAEDQDRLAELRRQHSAAAERSRVLDELEQRMEGVGQGAQELLARARQSASGPLAAVRGLVADFIQAHRQQAPLIDLALGDAAQYLVVNTTAGLAAALDNGELASTGRVGFVPLGAGREPPDDLPPGHPGVIGRADRFVESAAEFAPLVRRLLGATWIVATLGDALRLAGEMPAAQFVTEGGVLVDREGAILAGPRLSATGLISRRSELRQLRDELEQLAARIGDAEAAVALRTEQVALDEQQVAALRGLERRSAEALAEHRLLVRGAAQRLQQASAELERVSAELAASQSSCQQAASALEGLQRQLAAAEAQQADAEAALAEVGRRIEGVERRLDEANRRAVEQRVALAKSEERLGSLRTQLTQHHRDQDERQKALAESREHLLECGRRLRQSEFNILSREAELAEWFLHKEELSVQAAALVDEREQRRQERGLVVETLAQVRARIRTCEEQDHTLALSANEIRLQRDALASRLRDDYSIELAELEHEPSAEEQRQRDEVDQEIAELRRKLSAIGNVNLESLTEVEELESRYEKLSEQLQDLTAAKNALQRIIEKINTDSRRLFAETFETVRTHFQDLFRKLFGGGQADLLLDEGVDILDSGVEIIARPPGKEPRSISLLSGGEKTLTCVALLLAIFRSRPSPFCVLDEVDAALDEINIERFIAVLREFLAWTQFVIVTHSKKTMTCANTLHGVTMQESGVSKRVSVRFEDVSDNGEIRLAADASGSAVERPDDETQAA